MNFKKIICYFFCVILILPSTACTVDGWRIIRPGEYSSHFIMPEYDENERVDIFAFFAPDFRFPYTQERFDEVAEAGFTLIYPHGIDFGTNSSSQITKFRQYLGYAQNANLKMFVADSFIIEPNWRAAMENNPGHPPDSQNAKFYKNHPAFYGIWMDDESQSEYWPYLGEKVAFCKDEFPDKMLGTNTCVLQQDYAAQLHEYMDTVKPNMLSFDQYPLVGDTIRSEWLNAVAITRYIARQYGVLSSNWIQMTGGYWDLRPTTERDLRWQIAVCMAYGYDMIEEYSYSGFDAQAARLPEAHSEKLFTEDGERTELYNTVKKVNNEVHNWGYIYKAFKWYGTAIYKGAARFNEMIEVIDPDYRLPLSSIDCVESITANQDLLVGAFVDENLNDGIMITNLGYCNDVTQATNVTVKFDSKYAGVMVCGKDYNKEEPEIIVLNKGKATINIQAGEGKFLIPLIWK